MTGRHAGEAEPDAVGQQGGAEQAAAPVCEAPLVGDPATALRAEDGHLVTGEAVQARESEVRPEAPSGADLEVIPDHGHGTLISDSEPAARLIHEFTARL